jgi:hypothetical protein
MTQWRSYPCCWAIPFEYVFSSNVTDQQIRVLYKCNGSQTSEILYCCKFIFCSPKFLGWPQGSLILLFSGTTVLSQGWGGHGVKWIAYLHLLLRLILSGAVLLLVHTHTLHPSMQMEWATLKLFICLIKHPTLETPGKAFVTSTLEGYEWSFSFPSHFTPMVKSSWYPLDGGKEKSLPLLGIKLWFSGRPVCSLNLQFIFYLKALLQFHCNPQGRVCMSELLYELLFEDLPGGTNGNWKVQSRYVALIARSEPNIFLVESKNVKTLHSCVGCTAVVCFKWNVVWVLSNRAGVNAPWIGISKFQVLQGYLSYLGFTLSGLKPHF